MSKPLGKFLKKFVGPVNVRIARKEDKLKVKDEYNNYRVNFRCFPLDIVCADLSIFGLLLTELIKRICLNSWPLLV
jgi:hypothetical protein